MKSVADITNDFIQRKKLSQPSSVKTCGSTFKIHLMKKHGVLLKDRAAKDYLLVKLKFLINTVIFLLMKEKPHHQILKNLSQKLKKKFLRLQA